MMHTYGREVRAASFTTRNGSPYFMPGARVARERRLLPYMTYKDDNGRWRCGRVCAWELKCKFLSLCGLMIGGEEEHQGKRELEVPSRYPGWAL